MGKYKKSSQAEQLVNEHPGEGPRWQAEAANDPDFGQIDALSKEETPAKDQRPLPETVNGLASVVSELKSQLMQLVKSNEALELDNETAQNELSQKDRVCDRLIAKIREMEETSSSSDDLKAEIAQLQQERDALAVKVRDLGHSLSVSEQRVQETTDILDRFRAERNDVSAEAACLDSQFSRAMKVIAELRADLQASNDQKRKLAAGQERLKRQLEGATDEREAFKTELMESRNALEEVRRSILSASKESKDAFYK